MGTKIRLCDLFVKFLYSQTDEIICNLDRSTIKKIRDDLGTGKLYYIISNYYPTNTLTLPIVVKLHVHKTNIYLTLNPDYDAKFKGCEALGSTLDTV